MSGLKKWEPALRIGQYAGNPPTNAITADELDKYEIYYVINPAQSASGAGATWVGTFVVGGTSTAQGMVVVNAIADYPRNAVYALAGSSAGMAGTFTLLGRDQFGSVVSETVATGTASNGGTVVGTQVFAQYTSGTLSYGTFVGNGTARIGLAETGTTAVFGLPDRLGSSTDVKAITLTAGTGAVSINGGTIGTYVDVTRHAVRAPLTLAGTQTLMVWYKSSANPEAIPTVTNLPQRT